MPHVVNERVTTETHLGVWVPQKGLAEQGSSILGAYGTKIVVLDQGESEQQQG